MTLPVAIVITADGKAAKAELATLGGAADKAGSQVAALGRHGATARGGVTGLGNAARQADAAIDALAASEAAAVAQTELLGRSAAQMQGRLNGIRTSGRLAGGSVGNLTSQFNDLGVMMMAGQSPLQLALQQGTQITQVIGPMGARGAVAALGQAFVGLLSPINFVTIGAIAAGAALVRWLTGAGEKVRSFDDALADLKASLALVTAAVKAHSSDGIAEAIRKYGELNAEVLALIENQRRFAIDKAMLDAQTAMAGLKTELAGVFKALDTVNQMTGPFADQFKGDDFAAKLIAQNIETIHRELGLTVAEANALRQAMSDAASATTFEAQAAALSRVNALMALSTQKGGELAGSLLNAEDIMRQLAHAAPAASWMNAAISGVMSLGEAIRRRIVETLELKAQAAAPAVGPGRGGDPRQFGGSSYDRALYLHEQSLTNPPSPATVPGLGTGGGGIAHQGKALDALRQKLEDELALLRETDPVQKELLKNREALVTATDAERAAVTALISERIEEEKHLAQLKETQDATTSALYDALKGLALEGKTLGEVIGNLADKIAEAALQAALLGEGPLAGLLGGGDGGFLGTIVKAILPGKAEGGMIHGPGSGTSDDVLMWGSSGEFVMNAKATRRHRHLLEALNAGGGLPGFARGGAVTAPSFAAPVLDLRPVIQIENRSGTPISGEVEESTDAQGRRRTRLVLADAVGDALTLRGGGARRALRNGFGVTPRGTRR